MAHAQPRPQPTAAVSREPGLRGIMAIMLANMFVHETTIRHVARAVHRLDTEGPLYGFGVDLSGGAAFPA